MRLGVVGLGFVGQAVFEGLQPYYPIDWYDPAMATAVLGVVNATNYDITAACRAKRLKDLKHCDIVFVCVPTPMIGDGSCDISIVTEVVDKLYSVMNKDAVIVIKSTVPPETTQLFNTCEGCQVVFNPEFLTEANYLEDFRTQDRIIIGGPRPATSIVKQMYTKPFPKAHIIKTDSTHAEMVKYMSNTFLAVKVAFSNEIKQICDALHIDYDKVVEYATLDTRLGKTHWNVPGPDGHLGFGGTCFPKDINSLIDIAHRLDVHPTVLEAAWRKNLEVRPMRDWEKLVGRAVKETDDGD